MLVVAGSACGSGSSASTPAGTTTTGGSTGGASAPAPPECPNPEGQACLGRLAAGTYTTMVFHPAITYTVPAGWTNFEDTPGNFLLVPRRGNLPGVNGGTSDFIGIYASVAAEVNSCTSEQPVFGVGQAPRAIAGWIGRQPGLRSTPARPVTVGGLAGVVMDITEAPGAGILCPAIPGPRYVAVIMGLAPSGLDHGLIPGLRWRLYLLAYGGGSLAIEVDDVAGGGEHLAEYTALVKKLRFGA
jgi:hypothetical protein